MDVEQCSHYKKVSPTHIHTAAAIPHACDPSSYVMNASGTKLLKLSNLIQIIVKKVNG